MPILITIPGLLVAALAFTWPLWLRIPFLKDNLRNDRLTRALPWLRSAGLLYLVVVAGWVSMRDAGISGQTIEEWVAGSVAALVLGAIGGWLAVRFKLVAPMAAWIQDETRWTLYRAVAWPLLIFLPAVIPVVWLVAAIEAWLECRLAQKIWNWQIAAPWLIRATASALLFGVAHNFSLAIFMYLMAWLVITIITNGKIRIAHH